MYHSLGGFFKMPETRDAIAAYARSYLEDVQDCEDLLELSLLSG